ncbi:tripartite tricarboxylate transporter TctB family protein [uncultured Cohaesibacter sp.]|uniref:tripartite tricarboxylate transporter TctB family protein n=1 Tax=uncultured Cohaesibacter sp. TaxID=1002546 RepID=UPI002A0A5813|nr:tripartite tricarboxylate transporter TctB family protein [uncultured Cohaesibacter sp.]
MTSKTKHFQLTMPALTSILLLVSSLVGIWIADSEIQIFSFGDQWPDARTVPVVVLWLLAAISALRLILNFGEQETPIGPARRYGQVFIVLLAAVMALWSMPHFGFLPGAIFLGIVATLALGERRALLVLGLPLVIAITVYYGGRYGIGVPLP